MKRFVPTWKLAAVMVVALLCSSADRAVAEKKPARGKPTVKKQRPKPKPKARSADARRRAARARADAPTPIVLRFKHINVRSFAETLDQLGRRGSGMALRNLPIAVNEEANAVVVVARKQLAKHLKIIAEGLDKPNEYRQRMRQREMHERQMRQRQMHERALAGRMPGRRMGPHQPGKKAPDKGRLGPRSERRRWSPGDGPPRGDAPQRRVGPEGRRDRPGPGRGERPRRRQWLRSRDDRGHERKQRPEHAPVPGRSKPREHRPAQRGQRRPGGKAWQLSLPRVAKRLNLTEDQRERIQDMLAEARERFQRRREQIHEELRDMPPEQRRQRRRELMEEGKHRFPKAAGELRERIFHILRPEQREAVEEWLEGPALADEPHRGGPAEE